MRHGSDEALKQRDDSSCNDRQKQKMFDARLCLAYLVLLGLARVRRGLSRSNQVTKPKPAKNETI